MSKLLQKYARHQKPFNYERLVKSSETAIRLTDKAISLMQDNVFATMLNYVSNCIFQAATNARLSSYDEKIYDYYKSIIESYIEVVLLYDLNRQLLTSSRLRVIVDGIYAVLNSQIKQQEHDDELSKGKKGSNPIILEKRAIIGSGINICIRNIRSLHEKLLFDTDDYTEMLLKQSITKENVSAISTEMFDKVCAEIFQDVYKSYAEAITLCHKNLYDFSQRKAMYGYYELLKKEYDLLSSLIIIQVNALEAALKSAPCTKEEAEFVSAFVKILQQAYQYLGSGLAEISECFKEIDKSNTGTGLLTMTQFKEELLAAEDERRPQTEAALMKLAHEHETALCGFYEQLNTLSDELLDKIVGGQNYYKTIYDMQKEVSEQIVMTDEIMSAFSKILEHYEANKETLLKTEQAEIIKGISETISIKLENMQETKVSFEDTANEIIKGYKGERLSVSDEEREKCFGHAINAWNFYVKEKRAERPEFIDLVLNENEITETLGATVDKLKVSYENKMNENIGDFKKECLLFEISTFEEIISYSVSRLLQSDDKDIKAYCNCIQTATETIMVILKKNDIEIIRPLPHEQFNAKEHEVFMAEKNADFKKGEIIKTMNSGYKQRGTVIMRANIIAAR